MKRRQIVVLLLLALAGAAAYQFGPAHWLGRSALSERDGRGVNRSAGGDSSRGFEGPTPVTVAQARVADVPVTIDAVGAVQALNTVTIRTQVDGRLIQLGFTEGQDVRKGDVIALIDPSLYQAQYDQAVAKKAQDEATLANARIDLVRYQKLTVGNFGSQQQYATQKALVTQLEAQIRGDQGAVDNTKATLDFATIRSPIDGRTGIRQVDVGNILHASDQTGIVVITQLKPIYVTFTVPQQALPMVQKAQAGGPSIANALAPDNASLLGVGAVAVIDNQIDQTTGTVRIKATYPNEGLTLWPGQFVNVRLIVDVIKHATVVPAAAVQRGPNGAFVYVLNDDATVSMRPITLGRQDELQAVVTSGLNAAAKVATTGFTRLTDGAAVQVAETAQNGAADAKTAPDKDSAQPADGERKQHKRDWRRGEKRGEPR